MSRHQGSRRSSRKFEIEVSSFSSETKLIDERLLTVVFGVGRDNTRQALAIERDAAYEKVHELEKMLATMQQVQFLPTPRSAHLKGIYSLPCWVVSAF